MSRASITSMVGILMSFGPKTVTHVGILEGGESSLVGGLVEALSDTILLLRVRCRDFDFCASLFEPFLQLAVNELSTTIHSDNFHLVLLRRLEFGDEVFNFLRCVTLELHKVFPAHSATIVNDSKGVLEAAADGGLEWSLEVHVEAV